MRSRKTPVDRQTLETYFNAFGLTLTPTDYAQPPTERVQPVARQPASAPSAPSVLAPPAAQGINQQTAITPSSPLTKQQDWGEAIDVSIFHGRTEELSTLAQWIEQDRCRLIGILGMGGIGKTALSVKLAEQLQPQFELIIWRLLRNAPTLVSLLGELVPFLSHQQETQPTVRQLLRCLRNTRCLVILDNLETLLQAGSQAGEYRPGYEQYGELLRLVSESRHQSCLLLTSREKPNELAMFEGVELAVRSLRLEGALDITLALLEAQGLAGTLEQKQTICEHYGCSPLALKIVASSIQDLFDGNIAQFLAEDTSIFSGVRRLLDQQFDRLSTLEHSIMYWLAINRECTSIAELAADIVPRVARSKILISLESLSWRSLIEKQSSRYTQQPVVMEYVTDRLTDQVYQEITQKNILPSPTHPALFHHHALLKTTVKDYVRESQARLILHPIIHQLQTTFGRSSTLEKHLQHLLESLRNNKLPGYGGGNLINLLHHLNLDLTDYDFSDLAVWQTYLQNVDLHQVNFQNADLARSVFTQTFGSIICLVFSPDGQLLATGDMDGEARLWQVFDGQPVLTFERHRQAIWSLAWSPNGQILATGSEDHSIKLWQIRSGACLRTLPGSDVVRAIDWHPAGV